MKLLILTLGLLVGAYARGDKCRALALAGGDDNGAFQAGAVMGLIESLPHGEAQWDVVTGNGAGAINALIVSQYAKNEESQVHSALNDFWTNFNKKMFYKDWFGWYFTGLTEKSGLYDSSPMKDTIDSLFKNDPKRFLGVGATDLISGVYVFFNSTTQTKETLETGIMASAAMSGFFPYVSYKKYQLLTGAIKFSVDILHAVNGCYEKGYNFADISVDVVMLSNKKLKKVDASDYLTIDSALRYLAITSYDGTMQVYNNAKHDFPEVEFRSLIFPTQDLPDPAFPYDFNSDDLQQSIALGISDAKKAISMEKYQ